MTASPRSCGAAAAPLRLGETLEASSGPAGTFGERNPDVLAQRRTASYNLYPVRIGVVQRVRHAPSLRHPLGYLGKSVIGNGSTAAPQSSHNSPDCPCRPYSNEYLLLRYCHDH